MLRGSSQLQMGANVSLELRNREDAATYRRDRALQYLHRSRLEPQPGQQTYAIVQPTSPTGFVQVASRHRQASAHLIVCTYTFAAPAAAIAFAQGPYEPTCVAGIDGLLFDGNIIQVKSGAAAAQPARSTHDEPNNPASSVLEMRPAHRSLAEKAQEEPSEFEREYPW
jgi:hypothetical protein